MSVADILARHPARQDALLPILHDVQVAHGFVSEAVIVEIPPCGDRDSFLAAARRGDHVRILERQEASAQHMLAQANALVACRAGTPGLPAGTVIETLDF